MRVKHVDLFDFMLDYLKSRNLLDKALLMQKEKGTKLSRKHLLVHFTNPRSQVDSRKSPSLLSMIS